MRCNPNFKKAAFVAVVSSFLFSACKQEGSSLSSDDNGGYASDASRIEWINNDVISMADAAASVYNGAYIRTTQTTALGTCARVATDTVSNPHTIKILFGSSDCTALDGRARRGTIIVAFNGRYTDTAQLHTITYDNYFIGGHQVMGSILTTRVDTTVAGSWYYKVQTNDSLDMNPGSGNSKYIVWKGNLVRKWAAGMGVNGSGDRSDDVFSISGAATLTRQNGHVYSFGIRTPLQFAMNCDYAESGVVEVGGYEGTRVLSYGDGGCDANAQVSIGSANYQIFLSK
jgi:hypothetical protein